MKRMIAALLAVALCLSLCALASPAEDSDAWVQAKTQATLRSEPSAGAPAVKVVARGAELEYLGKSKDGKWYKVSYKGVRGWVPTSEASLKWSTFY